MLEQSAAGAGTLAPMGLVGRAVRRAEPLCLESSPGRIGHPHHTVTETRTTRQETPTSQGIVQDG